MNIEMLSPEDNGCSDAEINELLRYARAHLQEEWRQVCPFLPGTEDARKRRIRRLLRNANAAIRATLPPPPTKGLT